MAPKKQKLKVVPKTTATAPVEAPEPEEAVTEGTGGLLVVTQVSEEVDIEELPGGGTRETARPSRRYSK